MGKRSDHIAKLQQQHANGTGASPEPVAPANLHITLMRITPRIALQFLKANTNNRPLFPGAVKKWAGVIRRGEWKVNGETIKFDVNGVLLDGQHRLHAMVETGIDCYSYVVRGLPPEVMPTIDTGRGRTGSDVMHLRGEENYSVLAAALRLLFLFDGGAYANNRQGKSSANAPTHQQLITTLDAHPRIRESIAKVSKLFRERGGVTPSAAVFLHYKFSQVASATEVDRFFEQLSTGEMLERTNAIYKLRQWFHNAYTHKRYVTQAELIALVIKTWNRRKLPAKHFLTWRVDEAMPEIKAAGRTEDLPFGNSDAVQ